MNTNVPVLRALHQSGNAQRAVETSLTRLATGRRINSASDDPAGSIAVTGLKGREAEIVGEISGLEQSGYEYGAKEGALSVFSDMLIDLQALAVRAADSGHSDDEKRAMQVEADSIIGTLDRLSQTTTYKGVQTMRSYNAGVLGAVSDNGHAFTLADLRGGGRLALAGGSELVQKVVAAATGQIAADRGTLGAAASAAESRVRSLQVELENTTAARGMIEDTDYAQETARLVRAQVQQEAAQSMQQLAQQSRAKMVLDLLGSVAPARR